METTEINKHILIMAFSKGATCTHYKFFTAFLYSAFLTFVVYDVRALTGCYVSPLLALCCPFRMM